MQDFLKRKVGISMSKQLKSMTEFRRDFDHDQKAVEKLFSILLGYGYECPVENPDDKFEGTPMADWITDVYGGLCIYFDYENWFRSPDADGDNDNHFKLILSRENYDYDAFTYDVFLSEHRNGRSDREDLPECGVHLQYVDCFYAMNVFLNLIEMRKDGLVSDMNVMNIHLDPIPEELWMRAYKQTEEFVHGKILK